MIVWRQAYLVCRSGNSLPAVAKTQVLPTTRYEAAEIDIALRWDIQKSGMFAFKAATPGEYLLKVRIRAYRCCTTDQVLGVGVDAEAEDASPG